MKVDLLDCNVMDLPRIEARFSGVLVFRPQTKLNRGLGSSLPASRHGQKRVWAGDLKLEDARRPGSQPCKAEAPASAGTLQYGYLDRTMQTFSRATICVCGGVWAPTLAEAGLGCEHRAALTWARIRGFRAKGIHCSRSCGIRRGFLSLQLLQTCSYHESLRLGAC